MVQTHSTGGVAGLTGLFVLVSVEDISLTLSSFMLVLVGWVGPSSASLQLTDSWLGSVRPTVPLESSREWSLCEIEQKLP